MTFSVLSVGNTFSFDCFEKSSFTWFVCGLETLFLLCYLSKSSTTGRPPPADPKPSQFFDPKPGDTKLQHIERPRALCLPLAKIQGLQAALQRWTGGSPRLLVYSLRVQHHLLNEERAFDSTEQAMEEVYENLKDQQAVASEVLS